MKDLLAPLIAVVIFAVVFYKPFVNDLRDARRYSSQRHAILHPYEDRQWHERYAKRHGFFWHPCPLCGKPFGGHESLGKTIPHRDPDLSRRGQREIICPKCSLELRPANITARNAKEIASHRTPKKKK